MEVKKATKAYELWLGKRIPLLEADLRLKHRRMSEGPFPFLRATIYRWVQLWPAACPELANAPAVLGVGDLHVENFGTWRDSEGRSIWGVNDFDEAWRLPYTNDLVRLSVSANLATRATGLSCALEDTCDSILSGYQEGLEKGGAPFVLAEEHGWLRELAVTELRDPTTYWEKFDRLPAARAAIPLPVKSALMHALPEPGLAFRIVHRKAGLGSLGRRRFAALAQWRGGSIAREAKELLASGWNWEKGQKEHAQILYPVIIRQAVRVPDPLVRLYGNWLIRRLAPDCCRIELGSLPKLKDGLKLLRAMGWETANIHLGTSAAARRILGDLKKRPGKWLRRATEKMVQATLDDWRKWVEP
jgi:Uncharacterized protein conserved in bacteria (DUF2252)